jgi:hypothetical protein
MKNSTMFFNIIILIDFLFFNKTLFYFMQKVAISFYFYILPNVFYFALFYIDLAFYHISNTFKWYSIFVHNVLEDPLFVF